MAKETIELEVTEELKDQLNALLMYLVNLGLDAAECDKQANEEASE